VQLVERHVKQIRAHFAIEPCVQLRLHQQRLRASLGEAADLLGIEIGVSLELHEQST
jgi:hypothetical protein